MIEKICRICKIKQSGSEFPNRKDAADGLRTECKLCYKAIARRNYARSDQQRENKAKYGKQNRAKKLQIERAYEERNREKRRQAAYARLAKRREQDPEKFYRKSKEHTARWKNKFPEKYRNTKCNSLARRRILLKEQFVEKVDRHVVYTRDAGKCWVCGDGVTHTEMHLDHIVPLCVGGEHSYKNTATCCPSCNLRRPRQRYQTQ